MTYFERLAARSKAAGTLVCVGLDPDFRRHSVEDVAAYNRAIIAATAPFAACYKPNIAFYEQFGIPGLRALEATLAAIPGDIPVIGDVKRGDMGNTAEAYARAMFEQWGFDAVTVAGYQGLDSVAPFLAYEGRGVYVLCRTSNPSSREFQELRLESGRMLFEEVALVATSWSPNAGLVVGATAPDELRRVRALVPQASLLVPGVGAQGGRPEEVIAAAGAEAGRIVVNASRSIYYAGDGPNFAEAAAAAARLLRDQLAAAAPALA
ncbi:MAG: orotidine-5'-phosphate decarboxylase [Chloroflexi bacterium]|nr:orotidine-5'-phosphate decarboxylase [Chloroflexota bacterium]